MKILTRCLLLPAIAALAACATVPEVQYAPQANFAAYHRFYWQPVTHRPPVKNPILDSEILDQRVRAAAVQMLLKHGYQQVDNAAAADFVVTYQTATERALRSSGGFRFGVGFGSPFYNPFYDPFWGAAYYPPYNIESYQQGDLIIDVMDARTHKLVWRGWTTAIVRPENFSQGAVNDMVKTILSRFPPP